MFGMVHECQLNDRGIPDGLFTSYTCILIKRLVSVTPLMSRNTHSTNFTPLCISVHFSLQLRKTVGSCVCPIRKINMDMCQNHERLQQQEKKL